jgi:hypothetical protein
VGANISGDPHDPLQPGSTITSGPMMLRFLHAGSRLVRLDRFAAHWVILGVFSASGNLRLARTPENHDYR